MLANPKILILDEATSRLDAYSESLVQDAQELLFHDRTTIVIAHRLTTIANASRFDHGVLVEQGTHEELLAKDGVFKALYETYYAHQGLEEITEDVAETARTVITEHGGEQLEPAVPNVVLGMSGMAGMMGSHRNIPPEMLEKLKARMENDPDSIPPQMRDMLTHVLSKTPSSDESESSAEK